VWHIECGGLAPRFADIQRFDLRDDLLTFRDQVGQPMKNHGAIIYWHRRPTALAKSLLRSGNRRFHVWHITGGDVGEHFAFAWVACFKGFSVFGFDPFAADEHLLRLG
jgi:hypothetical protein